MSVPLLAAGISLMTVGVAMGRDDPIAKPNHPPIELIPPIPMPEPTDVKPRFEPTQDIVVYDAETDTTQVVPGRSTGNGDLVSGGGALGADGAVGWENVGRSFYDMTLISNTADAPWRMNVKLVMRFEDAGGGSHYYVGSGTMQDAEVISTAGHCVWDNDHGYGWAKEIWVYPGHNPSENPYGYARGTYFASLSGWTSSGDHDYDVGLIRVTRAVGMLTGWFGWVYGGDCSWHTSTTYHNASYPAEYCGGSLHNGEDMYYWYGNFDSCPGNQLQMDTGGGHCFDTVWGGMSGSGAYYIDGSSRYVHAVCSTSDRMWTGNYCRFQDYWINYWNDTFIPGSRGSSFDLQPLDCNFEPATITAGQPTTLQNHLAVNATNGSDSDTYQFGIYLSTNDNISTGDTLLSTQNYAWTFNPMSTVRVSMAPVTIPIGTTSGTYWLGVVYDATTDGDSTNNDTDEWDAVEIYVNAVADPLVQSVSVPNGTYYHNDSMNVTFSVHNQGGTTANDVTVDIRASTNDIISTFDTQLGYYNYGNLSGGGSINDTQTVTIPDTLGTGPYYIGIIVSSTNDADSTNNTGYDPVTVTIDGRADLVAVSVHAQDGTFQTGDWMDVDYAVRNDGTITSGPYTVDIRASTNTTITTSDTQLALYNYNTLGVGSTRNASVSVQIPVGLPDGDYYIGIIVSPGTNENDNSDNTAYDATQITIGDCPPDWNGDTELDSKDFIAFLNDFVAGNADYNGDTATDSKDFIAFLNDFVTGC
jgi:hypothetical protein